MSGLLTTLLADAREAEMFREGTDGALLAREMRVESDVALAEIAELIEAARRAEVMFNTVRGCYERNPGNFMAAMRELESDVIPLRAVLARIEAQP